MLVRRVRTDGFIDPCIPTLAAKPPSGPNWVHEIKRDGYRRIVRGEAPPFGYSRAADGLAAFEAGRPPTLGDAMLHSQFSGS